MNDMLVLKGRDVILSCLFLKKNEQEERFGKKNRKH
jgi:hypothetical protein